MDIAAWLRDLGLERYAEAFLDNDVDARILRTLTADDLKELGVASLGHRKTLLEAIAALQEPADRPAAQTEAGPPAPMPREAERRQLTVMFVDLVGSTELSARLDPEDMGRLIRAYQDICTEVVEGWEGHIAKYLGDGVLAYFGWPQAHEDDAERAVRSGLELVEAVRRLRAGDRVLAARVGIATGLVMVGELVGQGAAREEAVVGETPNLAARLQDLAVPGTLVVAESTRRLLGGLFALSDLGPVRLKGFAEPLAAFRVEGEGGAEGRFEALRGHRITPLVGREHELAILLERWNWAKEGDGQVVLLAGEPGIGKSRVVRSLRERLAGEPHTPLSHYCSPHHTNSALYPVIGLLERAAGFNRGDRPDARLAKLEALLARGTEALGEAVPLVAALLGIETGQRYPAPALSPQRQKQRTLEVLVDQVEGLAAGQPVLAIYEDVHWVDPTTLEALDLLIERVQRLPVLVLITFRPEFSPPWTGHAHVMQLSLSRLTRRHGQALVAAVTAGKALPIEMLDQIIAKTDGVPLFVEELTKTVLESGLLTDAGDHYALAGALPPLAIPSTLQDSLMARLDRLAPVKEVAQIGALIGRAFSFELIAAVAEWPHDRLAAALGQLVESELVFRSGTPPQATYAFKHALVQEAAAQSLLKSRRQQLHAKIASVLLEHSPQTATLEPELLAHQYTEAGLPPQAIIFWQRAGERAIARCAYREAIAHLERGIQLTAALPDLVERAGRELDLQTALGAALMMAKGLVAPEVNQAYWRARELSQELGDTAREFTAVWGLWHTNEFKSEWTIARELADELMELASRLDDRGALLQAHHAQWSTHIFLGNLTLARHHAEQGIAIYRREDHGAHASGYGGHDPGVCARQMNALALTLLGLPDQALAWLDEGLQLARELAHPPTLAVVNVFAGFTHQMRRDAGAARAHAETAVQVSGEYGILPFLQMGRIVRGWAKAAAGSPDDGVAELDEMLQGARKKRRKRTLLPYYLTMLADAYGRQGRYEEALTALLEALERAIDQDELLCVGQIHWLRGDILLALPSGHRADAETCFSRALEMARRQQAKLIELRAATSLARLWNDRGEREKARDLLAPVYGWFTEGFDTADLKDAKALLDQLG